MPDLVVSLIPHFNRAIKDSLDRVDSRIPLVTILTDIADFPPHFWIEPQDQFVICGSDRAVRQACQIGVPSHKVLRVSGMILHPRFSSHTSRIEAGACPRGTPSRPANRTGSVWRRGVDGDDRDRARFESEG